MNNLDNFRQEIDKIDDSIIELLEERFNLVIKIGQYKKEKSLPIFDPKRELTIKQKLNNKKYQNSLSTIYEAILKESKAIQHDKKQND